MNLKIVEKKENPLLSRTEIVANLSFDKATPNRLEVAKAIAKEVKGDLKLTIVSKIDTQFGSSKAIVEARVYKDEKVLKRIERKNLVEKHVVKQKVESSDSKPDEAPKEEAKAEEPKEEATQNPESQEPVKAPEAE